MRLQGQHMNSTGRADKRAPHPWPDQGPDLVTPHIKACTRTRSVPRFSRGPVPAQWVRVTTARQFFPLGVVGLSWIFPIETNGLTCCTTARQQKPCAHMCACARARACEGMYISCRIVVKISKLLKTRKNLHDKATTKPRQRADFCRAACRENRKSLELLKKVGFCHG